MWIREGKEESGGQAGNEGVQTSAMCPSQKPIFRDLPPLSEPQSPVTRKKMNTKQ